jgi:hypothetical protein
MFVEKGERCLLLADADELLCPLEHILRARMWWRRHFGCGRRGDLSVVGSSELEDLGVVVVKQQFGCGRRITKIQKIRFTPQTPL